MHFSPCMYIYIIFFVFLITSTTLDVFFLHYLFGSLSMRIFGSFRLVSLNLLAEAKSFFIIYHIDVYIVSRFLAFNSRLPLKLLSVISWSPVLENIYSLTIALIVGKAIQQCCTAATSYY